MVLAQLFRVLLLSLVVAAFSGCSGGGGGDASASSGSPPGTVPPPEPEPEPEPEPAAQTVSEAVRFLTRSSFGAKSDSIDSLLQQSYNDWIDEQMQLPASSHLQQLDALLEANGLDGILNAESAEARRRLRMDAWWNIIVNGNDQLRQRVAFALSQILVISDLDSQLQFRIRGVAHYYDLLAQHAFGNYRDLLQDMTLNPMMGAFLSMRRNEKADPDAGIQPDENFARELMQLFTIGLVELNQDASPVLTSDGETIPSYGQDEVLTLARVFTGWNFGDAPNMQSNRITAASEIIPMKAFQSFHDQQAKTLFGEPMAAGQSAEDDLSQALDIVFAHPNVAPFVGYRLIQRLVTSNPSPAYIERVAAVFNDNGNGVRGDLAATIKAILLDPEALAETPAAGFGKLKEPLLKVSSLWRAFSATGKEGYLRYSTSFADLGQKPLGAPSVFNFYLPSYSPPGALSDSGLVAPETQILNEPVSISTSNRLLQFVASVPIGSGPNAAVHGVDLDLSGYIELADSPQQLVQQLDELLLAGSMSDQMRDIIVEHVNSTPKNDNGEGRVREALFLIVTSPEFAYQG